MELVLKWSFVLLLIAGTIASDEWMINKCCPKNHELDSELKCLRKSSGESSEDDFSWFPFDAIVDSKTLIIHRNQVENYAEKIRKYYKVNYGFFPNCDDPETKQFSFHNPDLVEWFNFIMDRNGGMKVHVSKPSSLHDPNNSILTFHKITNDSEPLPTYDNHDFLRTLPLADTCVDVKEPAIHVLVYCPCRTNLCVRKCCSERQHFSTEEFTCVDNGDVFRETPFSSWRPKTEGINDNYYLLSATFPSCKFPLLLKNHHSVHSSCDRLNKASDNEFTIFPNGSLRVKKYKKIFDTSEYCGEVSVSNSGSIEEHNFFLCSLSNSDDDYEPIAHALYGVLLIIGGVCLLLTVLVSLYLPNLRRKVHNKIALSHNASLMIANFTWAVPQLSNKFSPESCVAIAFLGQFFLLGSFFWMNVMCIDISMTFSLNRHLKSGLHGGTRKFIYYCIYAWGSTSVISIATMVMEYLPGDATLDYFKPGFACICGFNTANASMLIYLYGPMAVLLLMNFVLFVYTTLKIVTIQKQTSVLHKTDSNTSGGSSFQSDKQRYALIKWLILYAKLFLLMGITWVMEIISWGVGGPTYYWYFSDILNLLRAVFIFILFVCKRKVIKSVKKKFKRESHTISEKTNSGRSQTDVMGFSSGSGEGRPRGSIASNKSKTSLRSESSDFSKTAKFKPLTSAPPAIKESLM